MAIFNISAGHNPDGRPACGAVGLIKESTECRELTSLVIKYIKEIGDVAYDCTVNDGLNVSDILSKLRARHHAIVADLNVSIHMNAGANKTADGKFTGVETYTKVNPASKVTQAASRVNDGIAQYIQRNRGVKTHGLYFVNNVNNSLLIEVCFVDDPDDVKAYKENKDKIAKAIAEGLTGKKVPVATTNEKLPNGSYINKRAIVLADLNIRYTRPDKDGNLGKIIGQVKKGQVIDLGWCQDGWMGITCAAGLNKVGFINTAYIKII